MKIICLSDLHVYEFHFDKWLDWWLVEAAKNPELETGDVYVVSGDFFESHSIKKEFIKTVCDVISNGKPIIYCLGNHEFSKFTVDETKQKIIDNSPDNLYCLDVLGSKEINGINFLGNVLWYDGTIKPIWPEMWRQWLDSSIIDFDPAKESEECKTQILNNIKPNLTNILVTHCVPDRRLNKWSFDKPSSLYNQYSGCYDFLNKLHNIEYVICGHTHRYVNRKINRIKCINIGQDYWFNLSPLRYEVLEV